MPTEIELFDGRPLTGWHAIPRLYSPVYVGGPPLSLDTAEYREQAIRHPARWSVQDGAIVGEQWPTGSGYGGFLLSDASFADFELTLELRPDWPTDSGILLRKTEPDWSGIQILLDHRESGNIGGFYGNGIGGFHAAAFTLRSVGDPQHPEGMTVEEPAESLEPATDDKRRLLSYTIPAVDFLKIWKWGDWNEFRIRSMGAYPLITVWINGVKNSEIDLGRLGHPRYDKHTIDRLGRSGPIALEVHDNEPRTGDKRWGYGAKVRWRKHSDPRDHRSRRLRPLKHTQPQHTQGD